MRKAKPKPTHKPTHKHIKSTQQTIDEVRAVMTRAGAPTHLLPDIWIDELICKLRYAAAERNLEWQLGLTVFIMKGREENWAKDKLPGSSLLGDTKPR